MAARYPSNSASTAPVCPHEDSKHIAEELALHQENTSAAWSLGSPSTEAWHTEPHSRLIRNTRGAASSPGTELSSIDLAKPESSLKELPLITNAGVLQMLGRIYFITRPS
jgi:hypothetical protein